MLANPAVMTYILKGVVFTLVIAVLAVAVSLVAGSVLALVRNYCGAAWPARPTPGSVLRWALARLAYTLAPASIEIFRNTPLLLWIFICTVFCPCPALFARKLFGLTSVETKLLFKAAVALILFTSAVVAEIIRGGLNAVAKGQFEAGHSQGFSTLQIMLYIVLPQAYRSVIPTLLSQVITTIKDSSYLANVATIELMSRVKKMLSSAYLYNGTGAVNVSDVFVLFGLACVIYFVINFALSCTVRRLQHGSRRPRTAVRG